MVKLRHKQVIYKITQLGSDRTRTEPQRVWLQRPCLKRYPELRLKLAA